MGRATAAWAQPATGRHSTYGEHMAINRQTVDRSKLNRTASLPYSLRLDDFVNAMQDMYDFYYDVDTALTARSLPRLDDLLRPAIRSGIISDFITESLAKHSRAMAVNGYHNGHPDLVVKGRYANDSTKSGSDGVEIKSTTKAGGAVDTHGARDQWMAVFVYEVDTLTQPASARAAMRFTEVYCAHVTTNDFRRNDRGELGTRTATLDKDGVQVLRRGWVYWDRPGANPYA